MNESMGDDLTPLHCAIMSRHEGLLKMELLLSKGAGVN